MLNTWIAWALAVCAVVLLIIAGALALAGELLGQVARLA